MPVYKADEMEPTPDVIRPHIMMNQYGGELIKAGVITYAEGDAPPPHVHPTDEQWIYILEGRLAAILGDELDIVGPGDLIYIPRGVPHGIRLLGPL
ncbi:MAG: cupin domain-containing protein, partial [Alphaproteobacteria bacterium]|nr:cupin domain-containing protein [Alphaproteobacteria bacterium]